MPENGPPESGRRTTTQEARLESDLRALTLAHGLSRKVYGETGLEVLLQEVMDAAVAIVGAEHGTLQLLEGDSLRIVAQHGHEAQFLEFFASAETRASVCGEATRQGERVLVPDVERSPLFTGTESLGMLRAARVRAVQSTPIMSRGGNLLGILTTQWERPYTPGEHDLWGIDLLVRQAADFIEHIRIETEARHSRDRLELLSRTISSLLSAPDPQGAVEGLCNDVRLFLHCDVFFNFLLDRQAQRLRFNACGGVDPRLARKVEGLELGASLCGTVARSGTRLHARNLSTSAIPGAALVQSLGVRAYACHPLLGASNEVIGTLSFGTRNRDSFSVEDLDLMKAVTDHVAVAMLRRRGEDALRQANQRLYYHLRNTPLAVIEFDADLRICDWNPGAQRIFGWEAQEVLGRSMWEVPWVPEADRGDIEKVSAALRSGQALRNASPNRNVRKDGTMIWCEWYNSSLTDRLGKMQSIQSLVLDVTARKEAEEVLARHREELERMVAERTARLQELVGELEHFSYTITHDMRAPLRAMRGIAEILNDTEENWSEEERKKLIQRIITAAERMDGLITDALQYSKMVRQEVPLAPVDPGKLLRGMLETYPEFQGGNAEITVEQGLPLVMGNEAGLTQCFSNLLANAVKFVPPGQKPVVRVRSEMRGGWVRLWVEDNGIGISEAMKPRLFDMFSRGSSPQAGTGIGLALVRKVVDRMGGRVGVESESGRGSRFWVELRPGEVRQPAPEVDIAGKTVTVSHSDGHGKSDSPVRRG